MNEGDIATTVLGTLTLIATIVAAVKGIFWHKNHRLQQVTNAQTPRMLVCLQSETLDLEAQLDPASAEMNSAPVAIQSIPLVARNVDSVLAIGSSNPQHPETVAGSDD
ncbi:hypothetical protein EDC01DRAFT_636420 [Geopyxis carbonaria]|nr:hypothetical protein EDC01DRAFT_636420 [Geopyxis carbonaria]